MKTGDRITAAYTEALAYEVKKGGNAVGVQTTIAGASAPTGARPAGALAQQTTATVTIAATSAAPIATIVSPARHGWPDRGRWSCSMPRTVLPDNG